MTSVAPQIEEMAVGQAVDRGFRRGPWVATVTVLFLALAALTAWVVYNQISDESVPAEIEQLLDDYLVAWENGDEVALRELATEDFVINEYIYLDHKVGNRRGAYLSEHVDDDLDGVVLRGLPWGWQTEQVGSAIITGDGPWFVSIGENWIWESSHLDGTATYVIVDRDGALKIANHYWAGLLTAPGAS